MLVEENMKAHAMMTLGIFLALTPLDGGVALTLEEVAP